MAADPMSYNLGDDFDLFLLIREQLAKRIPAQQIRIAELTAELAKAKLDLDRLFALESTIPDEEL